MNNRISKKLNRYITAIRRRLNMPADVKTRVMNDFISSVLGRIENGQSDEVIISELGAAKKVAAQLNEQMKEYTYRKSPWRWLFLAMMVISCASLIFGGLIGIIVHILSTSVAASVGIIGGADGPTAIFIATSPDYFWYQTGFALIILTIAALVYRRLSRCTRK